MAMVGMTGWLTVDASKELVCRDGVLKDSNIHSLHFVHAFGHSFKYFPPHLLQSAEASTIQEIM